MSGILFFIFASCHPLLSRVEWLCPSDWAGKFCFLETEHAIWRVYGDMKQNPSSTDPNCALWTSQGWGTDNYLCPTPVMFRGMTCIIIIIGAYRSSPWSNTGGVGLSHPLYAYDHSAHLALETSKYAKFTWGCGDKGQYRGGPAEAWNLLFPWLKGPGKFWNVDAICTWGYIMWDKLCILYYKFGKTFLTPPPFIMENFLPPPPCNSKLFWAPSILPSLTLPPPSPPPKHLWRLP